MSETERVALVLSGGGARGALQVGGLHALLELGWKFQWVVGTSAGALNAALWSLYGGDEEAAKRLEHVWLDAQGANLLPPPSWRMLIDLLFFHGAEKHQSRLRHFLEKHGLSPDVRFRDLPGPEVRLVTADIYGLQMVVYGDDPEESVQEGVLASTALVPWMPLVKVRGRGLMDGGVVSNVPVEVALRRGATHIVVLDVFDPRVTQPDTRNPFTFLWRVTDTMVRRMVHLELSLAEAWHVPVEYIHLQSPTPIPVWDFNHTKDLLAHGYSQVYTQLLATEPQ